MSERSVPRLYWFVNEQGLPIVGDVAGNGQELATFLFFTSEDSAQLHRDQSTMEGRWQLTSSELANELIELCEQQSGNYDVFLFDPLAVEGTELHPARLDEVKMIIEDHVGASSWNISQYY